MRDPVDLMIDRAGGDEREAIRLLLARNLQLSVCLLETRAEVSSGITRGRLRRAPYERKAVRPELPDATDI